MKSSAIALRIGIGFVLVAVISLCASPAHAQYTITFNITDQDGTTNTYTPFSYVWGPLDAPTPKGVSDELTFTRPTDITGAELMKAAQSKQSFASADLEVQLQGTSAVTIQMTGVQIKSVRESTDLTNPAHAIPLESVTLTFDSVDYTFQPLTPTGQRAGPPVTFTVKFH